MMSRAVGLLILPAITWGAAIQAVAVLAAITSLSSAFGIVALFLGASIGCCAIVMVVWDVGQSRSSRLLMMRLAALPSSSMR